MQIRELEDVSLKLIQITSIPECREHCGNSHTLLVSNAHPYSIQPCSKMFLIFLSFPWLGRLNFFIFACIRTTLIKLHRFARLTMALTQYNAKHRVSFTSRMNGDSPQATILSFMLNVNPLR
jgi:hypothetical protein